MIGRYCNLKNIKEENILKIGMDFRKPEYRRAVFLRFYDFHTRYRSHPGCVYYLFPFLAEKLNFSTEQKLWFAFINGNTQNPITSYIIFNEFPEISLMDIEKLKLWFNTNYKRLEFDSDRKWQKKLFPEAVENYKSLFKKYVTQEIFFNEIMNKDKEISKFMNIWNFVKNNFLGFGRLSCFSYIEYLRIFGLQIECDNLFLRDIEGSRSHRNGLAKVLGRDDLDFKDKKIKPCYTEEEFIWLEKEAIQLLEDSRKFIEENKNPYIKDVGNFTLESTLCTFKSWFRKNRRYPNVYNDMLFLRIKKAEEKWKEKNLNIFWEARKKYLPDYLRLEDNQKDPGLKPIKQNHFLDTGEVIMMENEFSCFKNNFNKKV